MDLEQLRTGVSRRDWASAVDGDPLRIAVVGLGWFGTDIGLPAIDRSDYSIATVAVSGSSEKATRIADEHDLERGITYEQYHDGVATDLYDAVYVTTPNAKHLPIVETAAELGKHVLCEKPLEATVERSRALVDCCIDAGVTLMTAYRMQTTPEVRQLRDVIAGGAIGKPVHAVGTFSIQLDPVSNPDLWRIDSELGGSGALYDVGVYPINTLRFVLDSDPIAVSARARSESEGFEDIPDEHVTFDLDFPNGLTASCYASFNAYPEANLKIVGTKGQATIESSYDVQPDDRELIVETTQGSASVGTGVDEVVEEFDYFASVILGDTKLEPDGADGHRDMEIMEAIFESDETDTRIELPWT